jgi:pimeloyl-ACP methyl ester carboxylesterase
MSNSITYKNATIHFTDNGQGDVVLLLHGFLENLTMWNTLVPHVIKNHRVICVDLLGHGLTNSIGYVHRMEQMAEAVKAVLQHLNIDKTMVIGHSMGGYVGLALLEMNPDVLKGLCLMNSTAVSDTPDKKKNRDRAIKAVKQNYKTFVTLSIANLFRPKSRTLYKEAVNKVKVEAQQIPVQSIVAALEGMKIRKNRLELFKKAHIKKLVILGKKDAVLDYDLQHSYYKNSDINIVTFPDGHMSHIENNKDFTYNIMHFIENI